MSIYTRAIEITPLPSGEWRLISPLEWEVGHMRSGYHYVVPADFVSDLASIPRALRWLFDRGDARLAKASILHDHMLAGGWNRLTAAAEFHQALKADGVAPWRRLIMFLAVALWRYR